MFTIVPIVVKKKLERLFPTHHWSLTAYCYDEREFKVF